MSLVQRDSIIAFLRDAVARRIGISGEQLGNDMVLAEMGLKSIDVVLISGEVEDHFGIEIEPVMMFEHRTIDAVTDRLLEIMGNS